MIRYRDMAFCESLSCITPLCPLRLTPDVYIEARKWWVGMSGEPPVAVADYTMTCPDYREDYSTC